MFTNVQSIQMENEMILQAAQRVLHGDAHSDNTGIGMARFANVMDTYLSEEAENKKKSRFEKEKEKETKVLPVSAGAKDRKVKRDKKRKSEDIKTERVIKKEGAEIVPIFNDPTLGWAVDFKA
ncbi:MAG: hypothetical protein IIZ61_07360 [Lachnospiraceae bacterium]|nr:hypothetical protein [Lachnospiraceae bacterium]